VSILECEIETATHHAKVVLRAVYHIPAEIIDPADMRRDADFDATTELADCLRRGIGLLSSNKKTAIFDQNACPLAAAEDCATACKT